MTTISLSDGQTVDSENIAKAELYPDSLLITLTNGRLIKVHGPSTDDDAQLLEQITDRKYGVFSKQKPKHTTR
jgi:hypothetical protein